MTTDDLQDRRLIARFLAGDSLAFDQLMSNHEDNVFGICLRILGNREKALDAVQDTFLTVLRKIDRFEGRAAFSTWLYRVAVNACYDLGRKEKRKPVARLADSHDPPDMSYLVDIEAAELRPAIERALAELPPEFAAVIILSDLQDLPMQVVSEVLELPVGTVKSRLFRGRRIIAQVLQNFLGLEQRLNE